MLTSRLLVVLTFLLGELFSGIAFGETERTRPPIIPAWAFGHWVWEDIAHTRDAVEYLVGGYRTYGIPVDALIFDSPCFTSYNDFTWNEQNYPKPQEMIDELHRKGIKVLPFYTGAINRESNDTIKQKCDSYDFVVNSNFAINGNQESKWWKGPAVHIDFTNPAALKWWFAQLDRITAMGVDGAKIDAAYLLFGDPLKTSIGPMSNREFGYHYFKTAFDYHVEKNPDFVAMTYARGGARNELIGWPSTAHVHWVGDFRGGWQGIQDQLKSLYLSAQDGFSGLACEIGGYRKPSSNKEQFIRYTQLACFMPIMINGGANGSLNHHLPWRHDNESLAIYRDYVLLHKALTPYLFSTGVDAHINHQTIARNISSKMDCHCLGDWLFVKPITSDKDSITVTLPKESEWLDFWSFRRYKGGEVIKRTYPLDQYPVFIRAGAIIPIAEHSSFFGVSSEWPKVTATFAVFPGVSSSYLFHRPTGDGSVYEDIQVDFDSTQGVIQINAPAEGKFRILMRTTVPPKQVSGADSWTYDKQQKLLRIDKRGTRFSISYE